MIIEEEVTEVERRSPDCHDVPGGSVTFEL